MIDRHRWHSVVLSLATGLMVNAGGTVSAGESLFRSADESALVPVGNESHPPSLRKRPVAEGEVWRYVLDPRGDIEGLVLKDGAHMYITSRAADKLVKAIKPGQHVRVHGQRHEGDPLVHADVILNLTTGTIFTVPFRLDLPAPEQEKHLSMTEMTAEGTIEVLLVHALKGIVQGMMLSDDTQVRLPPDVNDELRRSFRVGAHVFVEGNGTATEHGRCLEALAMSLNRGKLTPLDGTVSRLP
jgi:hypothetical protein